MTGATLLPHQSPDGQAVLVEPIRPVGHVDLRLLLGGPDRLTAAVARATAAVAHPNSWRLFGREQSPRQAFSYSESSWRIRHQEPRECGRNLRLSSGRHARERRTPKADVRDAEPWRPESRRSGIVKQQRKRLDDPLELFDFLYATYRHSPQEKLLESSWPDVEALKALDTNEARHHILRGVGLCDDRRERRQPKNCLHGGHRTGHRARGSGPF